jgi:hypothetical protein
VWIKCWYHLPCGWYQLTVQLDGHTLKMGAEPEVWFGYELILYFYVVSTVHFGMKLSNDQRNAQVFNLFIYLLPP